MEFKLKLIIGTKKNDQKTLMRYHGERLYKVLDKVDPELENKANVKVEDASSDDVSGCSDSDNSAIAKDSWIGIDSNG